MKNRNLLRNYYFVNTMLSEISKFDVVIFSMTDVLILSDQEAEHAFDFIKDHGIPESDFAVLRNSCEQELRSNNSVVTLGNIYSQLHNIRPDWNTDQIMKSEETAMINAAFSNPVIERIFKEAVSNGKKIYVVNSTTMPADSAKELMSKCGLEGYTDIIASSDIRNAEGFTSALTQITQMCCADPASCIYIGMFQECRLARTLGMTAAVYKTPKEMYTEESDKIEALSAVEINRRYTSIEKPDDEEVVNVDNVAMMFNMSSEKIDNIKEYLIKLVKHQLNFKEFWALKGISFSVKRGERVGLIGTNGSGKSTMLKIISGVMKCTKGSVTVKGSIAPMIELGAGFDMELSARENVFLNGAILGYSHDDMAERYDEIIKFAELEEFQDVAIKNYSSGMVARLGFAIATSHVPDILIIDEILSVGDFSFQNKCKERISALTDSGATVLFVSHSASDIIYMCDRAVWLNKGELCADGEAQYIVEKYINR